MQSRSISNIPRIAVALAVSLMLAFMPFTVNLQQYRITLERNEAKAIAPVFLGAMAFLEECAAAAGFATVGEFVATGAGVAATGAGLTIGTAAGIELGNTASDNLGHLIDAADYPAWNTLSSSEKSNWGNVDNYNAAKYSSFLSAFGLGADYESYKQTWGQGSSFEFSSSGKDTLEQLGSIGQNWANGIGNTVSDLRGLVNRDQIIAWAPVTIKEYVKDPEDTTWPSGLSSQINFQITNSYTYVYTYRDSDYTSKTEFSKNVYMFALDPGYAYENVVFSKESFQYRTGGGSWNNASQYDSNGNYFYALINNFSKYDAFPLITLPVNGNYELNLNAAGKHVLWSILDGSYTDNAYKVIDYPQQEIENNQLNNVEIYFPESGITDDTNWNDFLSSSGDDPSDPEQEQDLSSILALLNHIDSDLHKFGFVNNDVLKVHDGAVYTELENIYNVLVAIAQKMKNWGDISDAPDLIGDFDFDELENKVPDLLETISELAPFGSILLLSEMYSILANYTQIESPELVFPFDFGGFDDQNHELIIDLSWLDDIKPLINFFCIAMLVIAIANATIRIVEIEAAS